MQIWSKIFQRILILSSCFLSSFSFANDTIPIKIWNDLILIPVKTDSLDAFLIFDNGATYSALDSLWLTKIAKENANRSHIKITDANQNKIETGLYKSTLQVGSAIFEDVKIIEINIDRILINCHEPIQGILGADIINKRNWKFNFDESFVVVSDKTFKDAGPRLSYSTYFNNLHFLNLQFLNHKKKIRANIDFGYSGENILLGKEFMHLFSGEKAAVKYGQTGASVSGLNAPDTSLLLNISDFMLSNIHFKQAVTLEFTTKENSIRIGNSFFRKYNVIINSDDEEYILSPRKNPLIQQTLFYGLSLFWKNGKCLVLNISSNENILTNNIQMGDEVVNINGKLASEYADNCALFQYLKQLQKSNQPLSLNFNNGKKVVLKPIFNSSIYSLP